MARSPMQRVLDVVPLGKHLTVDDIDALRLTFPEFDIAALIEKAGTMGEVAAAAEVTSEDRNLRALKFELHLALKALRRVRPEGDRVWTTLGAKLRTAATYEFVASVLSVIGGGGAAGAAGAGKWLPAIAAGLLACVASLFTLYSQWQRKSLREDISLSTVFSQLAEAKGRLGQLSDSLELYATSSNSLLLDSEEKIYEGVKTVLEVTARVEHLVALAEPLLGTK
jgi:hypothetical protein